MTEPKTRVRWTEEERMLLAEEMVRLLQAGPRQSKLQALLQAQQVLPEARRRTVAAWTMVREQIEPHMQRAEQAAVQAAQAGADAQPADAAQPTAAPQPADSEPGSPGESSATAAAWPASAAAPATAQAAGTAAGQAPSEGHDAAAGGLSAQIAQQLGVLARLGTQALEAALLQVLSSPAVAERLETLLRGAMAGALSTAGMPPAPAAVASASTEPPAQPARTVAMPRPKVLVAGLTPAQANELAEEFSESLDLRNWRPGETKDQLRSLGRVCSVAVLVTDALDHDTEATLKSMHLRIVKHSGGLSRLKERLHELVDSGMFNVLT